MPLGRICTYVSESILNGIHRQRIARNCSEIGCLIVQHFNKGNARVATHADITDPVTDFPECSQFTGHKRAICRGETDLPLNGPKSVNAYRSVWRLPPLDEKNASLSTSPEPIPLLIRGWNFAAAMAKWTLAGMPRSTQAEIDERLAICLACPHLQGNHCTKCGCACVESNRLINKLALATETCPEGKWGKRT